MTVTSIRTAGPYRRRVVDDELDELLPGVAALALDGAKAVGKTATAAARSGTTYLLDDPRALAVVQGDPERVLEGTPPVLLDEWQLYPQVWDLVRRAVDRDPTPGRFLLTGSASPRTPPTHSGAGRIVRVQMRPLTLAERGIDTSVSLAGLLSGARPRITGSTDVGLEDYVDEIVSGGFPGLRGLPPRAVRAQLDGYLGRVVDRDFPEQGQEVRRPDALRRWMAAYAAATSTTASYEVIRDAATSGHGDKPARSTTGPYRDTLERLWLLDPVPAWSPGLNHLKRLGSAPKHHLVDPALACRLLQVGPETLLDGADAGPPVPRDGTLLGALFESLVTLCVRVYAQGAEASVGHLRTKGGEREVDLVVSRDDGKVVAVEVKLAAHATADDGKHLRWLGEQLGPRLLDSVIVTTGRDAYRRPDGIAVVPAALLGP